MTEEKPKKHIVPHKRNICSTELMDRIRERLKLTKKQLPDKYIKQVTTLSNLLTAKWVLKNPDGFYIKDNGVVIVSKYLPVYFRGDNEEVIERIKASKLLSEDYKNVLIKKYQKTLKDNKRFHDREAKGHNLNAHTFFHLYRIMWFNKDNCAFVKARLYKFQAAKRLKMELAKVIFEGKTEYYEWQYSDFTITKKERKEEKLKERTRRKGKGNRKKKIQNE